MKKIKKIKIIGKAKIYETDDGKYVVKKEKKDLSNLFDYLSSRGITTFANRINKIDDLIRYEYVETSNFINDSDYIEFIKNVAILHYKTAYFKTESRKVFKDIYNKLIDKVDYLKDYYNKLIEKIDNEHFMSPSSYLIARNYTIISSNLYFIERELNSWYNLVKDQTKTRVCIVNNNLKFDNFIKGNKLIFTSWDNYLVDTPIIDIYKIYRNEYKSTDMTTLFKEYNSVFKLNDEEIKLFNIMISFPISINLECSEYNKVKSVKEMLDYTYRTSRFISSGVFKELIHENTNQNE